MGIDSTDIRSIYAKKSFAYKIVKRILDILLSGLALALLIPLFICVSIAIKLVDGGPVFFHGERYGKDMRLFKMHKFRSMVVDPDGHKLKELMVANEMDGHTGYSDAAKPPFR